MKKVIPTTRQDKPVLLVASQLPGVFVAAVEAALPRVVVLSGPVVVPVPVPVPAAAAVVPTILAAATARPDGLHVAARLPDVAVAEASTARSIII
jgi:hypothetical protein